MRQLTRSREKKIAGVAGGLAEYFDMDKTIWRAFWIFGCIVMPPAILAYFIMAFLIPDAPLAPAGPGDSPPPEQHQAASRNHRYRRLTKSNDRWVSGVAAGLADYFEVDPVLVRALWLASIFMAGTGILAYLILAIIMPRPEPALK